MVCLDADHPDIESFVNWKVREELKVAALVEGMKALSPEQRATADRLGLNLDYDFNGEAYQTVSGQNSNNSVRLTSEFFRAVDTDSGWDLIQRTDGDVSKTIPARNLWDQICTAAWQCADPGVQFDSAINQWHTCPASGRINASNPCSEYMFLDDTACNLASINLLKFYNTNTRTFDVEGYGHAIDIWTVVLEISVLMAAFPSRQIAELSHRYRTLGLGFANLGAMLMQAGIPYDSDDARAISGAMSAILTGRSYAMSARMAGELGPFTGYEDNREHMLRVIRNHRRAAHGISRTADEWEHLDIRPVPIDHDCFSSSTMTLTNAADLLQQAVESWDDALTLGEQCGFRNAQTTVIAPTGTIGLLMDCDTTGVEPDFALTKFKKLAGGGYFKIANQSLRPALEALGYDEDETRLIMTYVMGALSLDVPMPKGVSDESDDGMLFRDFLREKGYTSDDLAAVADQLPMVFEIGFAFNAWSMPEQVLESCGVDVDAARNDSDFNGLMLLGLTREQITELNTLICGTQTIEGAPNLNEEHLPVFDCANKCGPNGKRYIASSGHIRMMAAAQPFISGAISKTINLPNEATIDNIAESYWLSWELGLKANALYRDGCKLSQPLNTTSSTAELDESETDELESTAAAAEIAGDVAEAANRIAGDAEVKVIERVVERIIERPMRRRLEDTRRSLTHHFNVAGHEGYLTVGMYEDGAPGELFITMSKEGSTIGGLMDSLGTAISVALQYGVPIESLVTKFAHQRFEPQGMTTNREIPFAKSLVDYIFRWMGMEFVEGYREANAPSQPGATTTTTSTATRTEVKDTPQVKEDRACKDNDQSALTGSRVSSSDTVDSEDSGPSAMIDAVAREHASVVDRETDAVTSATTEGDGSTTAAPSMLNQSTAVLMGDAPACDTCGAITVRNGTCYKCVNCGNSMGCS
jgi:ribonucleoside-diphosphate reductase alpha chain